MALLTERHQVHPSCGIACSTINKLTILGLYKKIDKTFVFESKLESSYRMTAYM